MATLTFPRAARLPLSLLLIASTVACRPAPERDVSQISRPLISDQVHDNGLAGFSFLPPLVPRPGNFGEQVLGLWPTVNIDQIDAAGVVSQPVAAFTRTSGPFGERLRRHISNGPAVDDDGDTDPDGYFVARWKTALADAPAGTFFRIRVLAAGHQLGFADVTVVGTRKELRNVDRDELVPLMEGHTLRIKFRIERATVDRDGDGVFDWDDNCPTVANPGQGDGIGNGIGDACRCATSTDACPSSSRLFALMTTTIDGSLSSASIEIVDLATMTRVHSIPLGDRAVASLAVSADGRRAYISDTANGEVAVYDTVSGSMLAVIALPGAFDLALSPDGAVLYAGGAGAIAAIDTASNGIASQYAFPAAAPLGLSVAADGTRLGVITTFGGTDPAYHLFDTSHGLDPLAAIAIVGDDPGCDPFPNDTVFANADRALAWDSNCDSLYQIDLATRSQLPSATIATGRDIGSSSNSNNALVYLASSSRALVVKESNQLASIAPVDGTFSTAASFVDTPFVGAGAPDGHTVFISVVHRFVDGGGDSLDRIDTTTSEVTRSVYLFGDATKIVRDMRVVAP